MVFLAPQYCKHVPSTFQPHCSPHPVRAPKSYPKWQSEFLQTLHTVGDIFKHILHKIVFQVLRLYDKNMVQNEHIHNIRIHISQCITLRSSFTAIIKLPLLVLTSPFYCTVSKDHSNQNK